MIFSEAMLKNVIRDNPCNCEPTMFSSDGGYILSMHQHEDGTLIINSFEKKIIKLIGEQIDEMVIKYNIKKDNIFSMTQRGHDQC